MKAEWVRALLVDVTSKIGSGATPRGGEVAYKEAGTSFIRSMNVHDNFFRAKGLAFIDDKQADLLGNVNVESGDVLLNITGASIARCCLVPDDILPARVNQHVSILRPREEVIHPEFLAYLLTSPTYKVRLLGSGEAAGSTRQALTKSQLQGFAIRFPVDCCEQQRIVRILDEAFAGIAIAKTNAEKNLINAEALRVEYLRSIFDHRPFALRTCTNKLNHAAALMSDAGEGPAGEAGATTTGGRAAALRHIPGDLSLSVGMPARGARTGWAWFELAKLARLESGHTPSRRHPEYWGGDVPWVSIRDARDHHGHYIAETAEKTNDLGIASSSARVLPSGTVCLSRTASVGYVTVMERPMATSQDFVNWVCSSQINPDFLKYIFLAEGRKGLLRFASGAVHQTIYYPEAKAFHVCCPDRPEQDAIVALCDAMTAESSRLVRLYRRKLGALDDLKQSLLHQAFSGQL